MVAQKFSECFWNTEFTSNVGFEIVVRRTKEGRACTKEVLNFVKERSKVEDDYAKGLLRLSRHPLGARESGTFKEVLDMMRRDAEKAAEVHQDMSTSLTEQAGRMQSMKEKFASQCKQAEETVRKLQAAKKDLYQKMLMSQQNYQKKSSVYECAQQAFVNDKSAGVKAAKDLEKSENKAYKLKEEKLKANDAYESLVRQLESTRVSWETEMEKACETFEQAEMDRILFFRNEFWIFLNIDSKTMFDQDEANEEVRSAIENCDAQKDIQDFICSHQTGSTRPAPILYDSGEQKTTPKALRPARPVPPGSSTFFATGTLPAHSPEIPDDAFDPTYAAVD